MASSVLADTAEPVECRTNRRISILVMTKEAEERLLRTEPVAVPLENAVGTQHEARPGTFTTVTSP
jgi:hypothetical protein